MQAEIQGQGGFRCEHWTQIPNPPQGMRWRPFRPRQRRQPPPPPLPRLAFAPWTLELLSHDATVKDLVRAEQADRSQELPGSLQSADRLVRGLSSLRQLPPSSGIGAIAIEANLDPRCNLTGKLTGKLKASVAIRFLAPAT